MERVNELFKEAFDKTLIKHGFCQTNKTNNTYYMACSNPDRTITARFIESVPYNESTFGIRGIQAIGNFRFKIPPPGVNEPDFYIFVFHNRTNDCVEFIIIPFAELIKRNRYRNRINGDNQETEFVFYLMEGNWLVDASELGAEGRWYYIDGRMAEDSFRNYSEFLNSWKILTII